MTVLSANALEAAASKALSVLGSTELVASSITRHAASCKIARARQNNCRSPALRLLPPSRTSASAIQITKHTFLVYYLDKMLFE